MLALLVTLIVGAPDVRAGDQAGLDFERPLFAWARGGRTRVRAGLRAAGGGDSGDRLHRSGEVVWSAGGRMRNGERRVYSPTNIRAGELYVLAATARCDGPKATRRGAAAGRRTRRRRPRTVAVPQSFGLDFRVYVGGLEPVSLDVGVGRAEESRVPFRALQDNPQIRLEDHTEAQVNVRCTVGNLAVMLP